MTFLFLNLAVAFLTVIGATILPASSDVGSMVDSLLQAFDSQKGEESRQTANRFFELLEQEEFSDEKIAPPEGRNDYTALKALTWYWAGEWYFDRQDYARSMEYSSKAMNLCRFVPDPLLEADCANILSILYFRSSDYPNALEYAKKCLEIVREQKDISRISSTLNVISGICLASRQPAQGEQYILEAIRLCEQEKDSLKLAIRCGMAAEIYHSLGENDKSLEFSKRAFALDSLASRSDKAAIRLAQMADAYSALGENGKAQACLDKAMPVFKEVGNLQSWAISANLYGEILLEYGKASEAEAYFREALGYFSLRKDKYNESRSRLGLSKALLASDPAESARQMQIYGMLRDSLYDSQMNMGLNEMHARFQNERIQSERDRYRRSLVFLAALVLLIILTVSFIVLRQKHQKKKSGLSTRAETPVAENETQPEQGRQTAQSEESVFIENLSALIREAMDSGKVDLEEIASRMCISRTHLNRKVKAITGGTTSDLVLSYRIAKAKELLLTTDLPVWEVAEKCGISDPAYFSTLFKKAVGKSPGQLRKDQD